ncbi:DUF4111 domain-containing protein [Micromonospora sp. ATA32]|nr:DUF4111 domain-containing protein [Micromonospora sp. ATA32]
MPGCGQPSGCIGDAGNAQHDRALLDTRNVILTLARIRTTLATGGIRSKDAAADFVLDRLPAAPPGAGRRRPGDLSRARRRDLGRAAGPGPPPRRPPDRGDRAAGGGPVTRATARRAGRAAHATLRGAGRQTCTSCRRPGAGC